MFKTLKQYKINKQKMLHAFCNNSVPHHRGFNVSELTQMGIPVLPICDQQLKILKVLESYKNKYLLTLY